MFHLTYYFKYLKGRLQKLSKASFLLKLSLLKLRGERIHLLIPRSVVKVAKASSKSSEFEELKVRNAYPDDENCPVTNKTFSSRTRRV